MTHSQLFALTSETVAASGGLLLAVLEVGTGEEVAEDEFRDVASVLRVGRVRKNLMYVL